MKQFYVKDGQFWLDDAPLFIHAGEFHYFRTPADQWAHRLGLLKAAGFNAVASYIPWLWHQPEPGLTDFTGHSHPLRNLAGFLDLAADMGLFILARPGPYIMAEIINEGIPPWVFEQSPQAAFIAQDHQPQNLASYQHPDFLASVRGWYRAVFEVLTPRQITHGGKILMIQLDNEMGMPQWVRNIIDLNPDTLTRFADYLTATYGDDLPGRYPTGDLPAFLEKHLSAPLPPFGREVLEDYRRFYRRYLREYALWLWEEARCNGMEVPPVINIHGFANGGKTFPIGLSQLIDVLRLPDVVSATDTYPGFIGEGNFHQLLLVNEMTQALQNEAQPLFSIEFQAGGNQDFSGAQSSFYDLHARLCLSSGMRGINHYLFCDGENDPVLSPVKRHDWGHPVRKDGTLRSHYARYPQLSAALATYGEALLLARPRTVTTIGFLLDDFMTEVNHPLTRPLTEALTHQREVILFDMIARGLALTHRPFRALDLERETLDVREHPHCWVMLEQQCPPAVQQKLLDYVRAGGRLLLIGRMCREDFDHRPCTLLQDGLGITGVHTAAPFTVQNIRAFQYADVPVTFLETYTGAFDEVFATTEEGATVGFVQQVGAGKVLWFGAAVPANTLEDLDLIQQMGLRLGCRPLFTAEPWVDVRLSEGERGQFLFVANYRDDPVTTTLTCAGDPLCGGNPITLPARRGFILPLEWQAREDVHVHYVTTELTGISETAEGLTLHAAQREFLAELTLPAAYTCERAVTLSQTGASRRVRIQGSAGAITLRK